MPTHSSINAATSSAPERSPAKDAGDSSATVARRRGAVLFAFAIVAEVMANRYQPRFLFFPVHGFYLALLFFAAGTQAKVESGFKAKLAQVGRDAREKLAWFYGHNLLFGTLTLALAAAGVGLAGSVPSFTSGAAALESLRAFALDPLLDGRTYALFAPGWIVLALFIVASLFQVVSAGRALAWGLLMVALVATMVLVGGKTEPQSGFALVSTRVAFGLLFYLLGHLVATAGPRATRALRSPVTIVVLFLVADIADANLGITYDIEAGRLGDAPFLAVFVSTTAIALLLNALAHYVAQVVGDRSLLVALGRRWLYVLTWQAAAFFLVNAAVYAAGGASLEDLANPRFVFLLNRIWVVYLGAALGLPLLLAAAVRRLAKRPHLEVA